MGSVPKKSHVVIVGASLVLGGCAVVDEFVWPTLTGEETGTGSPTVSASSVSEAPPSAREQISVAVPSGRSTGTVVGERVERIRADLRVLNNQIDGHAKQLDTARLKVRQNANGYHVAKASILARLHVGTTPGNPELVAQWNSAQARLDTLSSDINSFADLSRKIASDASTASFLRDTTRATYQIVGALEADHAQLTILENASNQTAVVIDRLLEDVKNEITQQTTYVANERSNLTALSDSIRAGRLYGGTLNRLVSAPPVPLSGPALASAPPLRGAAPPLVVIRFDRPNVEFEETLFTALSRTLEQRPSAQFEVVAVASSSGTSADIQLSQSASRRHAEEVVKSMSNMGLPGGRIRLSSTTSGNIANNEVRIFVH